MSILEWLKVVILGIIQGITEWLPISSTGHMLLFDELFPLQVRDEFSDMFMVVIQLGSILAVLVLFWNKLWPFSLKKTKEQRKSTWTLWFKVLVAAIPAAVAGLLLDDFIEGQIYQNGVVKCAVIAGTLIVYGVAFIWIERVNRTKVARVDSLENLSYKDALAIGAFQMLALIPGTSRSGSTILGGSLIRVSRPVAAEFSFFLAVPMMFGASALKLLKFALDGFTLTGTEIGFLIVGMVVAFAVSLVVIRFLMDFVRRHSFEPFGWYRIGLGVVLLAYMVIRYIVLA